MFTGSLTGVDVRVCLPSTERKQVRFPRSKKRRIRKKWRRNPRNWVAVLLPPVFYRMRSPSIGLASFAGSGSPFGVGPEFIATNQAGWNLLKETLPTD